MASIGTDENGRKRILFVAGNGSRKTIRLGKATMKQATAFKVKIESLAIAASGGSMDEETARWLADLPDTAHDRIAAVGLAKPRSRSAMTLKAFLDDYFAGLSVKLGTATAYGHTRRNLLEHFGETTALREIDAAGADKWRQWLKTANIRDNDRATISEATISRRVGVARQIFKRAVKWKLIGENPFADVKGGSQSNKARMAYIGREDARKVLDACPDAQWRLLFALSRYGGLRCPSEHLALTWGDVDWEHGRLTVHSPKTEHHVGGDCRIIPLFPELRPYLQAAFDEAEPGTTHVITRCRDASANLRTQLQRIIRRAGVKPWPKLFHNLRATRQTELAEKYPIHVVCQWIGNSRAVAQEHYLQVTDAHFADAAKEPAGGAAQNAAQYPAESASNEREAVAAGCEKEPVLLGDTDSYITLPNTVLGAEGFEPSKA
jgi:integrase